MFIEEFYWEDTTPMRLESTTLNPKTYNEFMSLYSYIVLFFLISHF